MSATATRLVCVFSLAVLFVVVAVGDDLSIQVEFSESFTVLQTASCIADQQTDDKSPLMNVKLHQTVNGSTRLLEYLNGQCPTPPCFQKGLRFAASRGSQEGHTFKLTLAWEASASLNIDEDELICTAFFSGLSGQEVSVPISVRSFPTRKLRWRVNKTSADLTRDSSLEIRVKDGVKGWKLLGGAAGVHVNDFMFDPLGTEAGGVTLVKVVNSPNISSLTLLHTLSSDPEWKCSVREGGFERACGSSAKRHQEAQEAQEAHWLWEYIIVLLVVVFAAMIVIVVLIVVLCRMKKQLNRGSMAGRSRREDSATKLATPINEHGPDDSAIEEETALTIRIND